MFVDSRALECVSVVEGGNLFFDHVTNLEPLVSEVNVHWVETPALCIGGKVRVSKPLDCPTSASELMFDPGASSAVYQPVASGVNMEEVVL